MKLLYALVTVLAAAGGAQALYGPPIGPYGGGHHGSYGHPQPYGHHYPSGPTHVHNQHYAVPHPVPYPVVENVPVERLVHRTLVRNVPHPVPVFENVPVPVPVPRIRPVPVPVNVPRVRPVPVQSNHFHYKQVAVPVPY